MIYIKVAHTNDEDADYFKVRNLGQAIDFIYRNEVSDWVMSDIRFDEMPEDDYTLI